MKPTMNALEYAETGACFDAKNLANPVNIAGTLKNLRDKLTDRLCIGIAITATVALVLSMITCQVPAIIASGLTALLSVAIAPMNR